MTKSAMQSVIDRLYVILSKRATENVRLLNAVEQVVDEQLLERCYWTFDAMRKGYSDWKGRPQSERDAFKTTVRAMHVPIKLLMNRSHDQR